MTQYLDAGYISPPGEDVFPTTGPHLDVRVLNKEGKYIDPNTIRSLLTRLRVGKDKTPLYRQTGDNYTAAFPITSGFGRRTAPTAGASTQHMGVDFGIPEKTKLFWEGPGTFTPGRGYGTIQTTDAQGNPFEVRLLHTKGGQPSQAQSPEAPQTTTAGDTIIVLGGGKQRQTTEDFLKRYADEIMSSEIPQFRSVINPSAMLAQAFQPQELLT